MDVDFKISGLKELNKELKKLPADFRNKALVQTNRAAANVIHKEAVRLAPENTGDLKRSIKLRKQKTNTQWEAKHTSAAGVKVKGKPVYYAHMVEFGTAKMSGTAFMRPAFDSKKQEAVKFWAKRMRQKIDLFNKKLRAKKAR